MAKEVTAEQIQMLDEMVARAQKAADIIATYDQARVDRLCQAVAAAVCDMKVWAQLADEAVDETDPPGLPAPEERWNHRGEPREGSGKICQAGGRHRLSGPHHQPLPHPRRPGGLRHQGP